MLIELLVVIAIIAILIGCCPGAEGPRSRRPHEAPTTSADRLAARNYHDGRYRRWLGGTTPGVAITPTVATGGAALPHLAGQHLPAAGHQPPCIRQTPAAYQQPLSVHLARPASPPRSAPATRHPLRRADTTPPASATTAAGRTRTGDHTDRHHERDTIDDASGPVLKPDGGAANMLSITDGRRTRSCSGRSTSARTLRGKNEDRCIFGGQNNSVHGRQLDAQNEARPLAPDAQSTALANSCFGGLHSRRQFVPVDGPVRSDPSPG